MPKISELPTTNFPSLEHVIPAERGGETHKLPISQIRELMLFAASEIAAAGDQTVQQVLDGLATDKASATETSAALADRYTKLEVNNLLSALMDAHYASEAGQYVYLPGGIIPSGMRAVKANGATLIRTDYPHLWAYAQVSGMLAASQGAKTAAQFGPGNGSTTFSLPDARGYFLRAFDDGRGIDSDRVLTAIQLAQMQGHAHEMNMGWDAGGNGYLWNDANGLPVYGSRSLTGSRSLFSKGVAEAGGLRVGKTGPATDLTGETRPVNLAAVLGIRY